jgi:predicted alpha/beta superfamily hydrolase
LIPYIDKNYRTITSERTLWGSSYGGYFAMYTLFHACDTTKDVFENYIVASSAAYKTTKYNGRDLNLFDYERMLFEKTKELKENLFLTVGGSETAYFKDSFNNIVRVLNERNYEDYYFKSYIDPGKDHYTVWEPTLYEGIRMFLKK